MARTIDALISDGVIDNEGSELAVTESSPAAQTVRVGLGIAIVKGYYFEVYSTAETLAIAAANATNPRIDRVVIRRDLANRQIVLAVLTGTPAASPSAPALTQISGGVWEHSLAQISVPAASASVINARITDQRTYATSNIGSALDLTSGHDHDGADSKKVTFADLLSIPATFAPSTHAHTSAGTGGTIAYASLTSIPTSFNPDAHAHAAASEEGQIAYTNLTSIPATFAPAAHDHSAGAGGGNVPYANVSGKPSTFAPSAHASSHAIGGADAMSAANVGAPQSRNTPDTSAGGKKLYVGTSTPTNAAEGDVWIKG
jgi:hypothetical protein